MAASAHQAISGERECTALASRDRPLCEYLVEFGKLDQNNVRRALALQHKQSEWEQIGSILVKLGLVSEHDVAQSLSRQLGLPLVDKQDMPLEAIAQSDISPRFLKQHKAVVLEEDDDKLTMALANPDDS